MVEFLSSPAFKDIAFILFLVVWASLFLRGGG